ncbi:hypothetical protein HPB50_008023 [Hyalomma asiaticum]|uniref:Uncharacterized protein n=1 Tax=Hyalomma asiaticum TaxID=266040 RepID=A0ACB7SHI4_HYAAI|nr:hypothetical protein HPB50_008023 [Hyalomma asiaticum]
MAMEHELQSVDAGPWSGTLQKFPPDRYQGPTHPSDGVGPPRMCDILAAPLRQTPYDTSKKAVLVRTAVTERKRLQMFLSPTDLGDRHPSQLLRQFIQRLPPVVLMALTTALDLNLSTLVTIAEKLCEIAPPQLSRRCTVNNRSTTPEPSS